MASRAASKAALRCLQGWWASSESSMLTSHLLSAQRRISYADSAGKAAGRTAPLGRRLPRMLTCSPKLSAGGSSARVMEVHERSVRGARRWKSTSGEGKKGKSSSSSKSGNDGAVDGGGSKRAARKPAKEEPKRVDIAWILDSIGEPDPNPQEILEDTPSLDDGQGVAREHVAEDDYELPESQREFSWLPERFHSIPQEVPLKTFIAKRVGDGTTGVRRKGQWGRYGADKDAGGLADRDTEWLSVSEVGGEDQDVSDTVKKWIAGCRTDKDVMALVEKSGESLEGDAVALAFARLAALDRSKGKQTPEMRSCIDTLILRARLTLPIFSAKDVANMLFALRTLKCSSNRHIDDLIAQSLDRLFDVSLLTLQARDLARIMHSLGCLRPNVQMYAAETLEKICVEKLPSFHPWHVSMCAKALAYMDTRWGGGKATGGKLVHALVDAAVERMLSFNADELSDVVWAIGKLDSRVPSEFVEYASARALELSRFNRLTIDHVTHIFWGMARLRCRPPDDLLDLMHNMVVAGIDHCSPFTMSQLMWAHSRLQITPPEKFIAAIAVESGKKAHDFEAVALSGMLYSLAQLPGLKEEYATFLLHALLPRVEDLVFELGAQSTVNILQSLAKVGLQPGHELVSKMEQNVSVRMKEFEPRGASTLLEAFSRLRVGVSEELMQQIVRQAIQVAHQARTKDVALLLASLARLGRRPPPSVREPFEKRLLVEAEQLSAADVSTVMWSYGKFGLRPGKELYRIFVEKTDHFLKSFDPSQLASTLWGFARVHTSGSREEYLYDVMKERVLQVVDKMPAAELAIVIWSVAHLKLQVDERFARTMSSALLACTAELSPQGVTNVLWAYYRLGLEIPDALANSLVQKIVHMLEDFIPQGVAQSLWSLFKLRYKPQEADLRALSAKVLEFLPRFELEMALLTVRALRAFGVPKDAALLSGLEELTYKVLDSGDDGTPENLVFLMLTWANAGMRPNAEIYRNLHSAVVANSYQMSATQISQVLWSIATLRLDADELMMGGLTVQILDTAKYFRPVDISQTLWAYATMDRKPEAVVVASLTKQTVGLVNQFKPAHIANLLWAFARLDLAPSVKVLSRVSQKAPGKGLAAIEGAEKRPHDVAEALWTITSQLASMVNSLSEQAVLLVDDFDAESISRLMWALARLRMIPSADLVQAFSKRAHLIISSFEPEHLSDLLWAFAKMRITPAQVLFKAACARALETISDFSSDDTAEVFLAFASLRLEPSAALLQGLIDRAEVTLPHFDPEAAQIMLGCLDAIASKHSDTNLDDLGNFASLRVKLLARSERRDGWEEMAKRRHEQGASPSEEDLVDEEDYGYQSERSQTPHDIRK